MSNQLDLANKILFDLLELCVENLNNMWFESICNAVEFAFNLIFNRFCLFWIGLCELLLKNSSTHLFLSVLLNHV